MNKKYNMFLVILFLLYIALPFLLSDKIGGKVSESENRTLAMAPDVFDEQGKINFEQTRVGLEAWINDNAFGRSYFSEINRAINIYLFNQDNDKNIMLGKDKWIYLMHNINIKKVQKTDCPSSEDAKKIEEKLYEIKDIFNKKNIKFCVNVFPNKVDIYPEYLNGTIKKVNNKGAIEFYEELSKKDKNLYINVLYNDMKNAKQNTDKPLYYKAIDNNHWNFYGAFIGYQSIMNNVKKQLPQIKVLKEENFNITPFEVETRLIYDKLYTTETNYNFEFKDKSNVTEDKEYFNRINFASDDSYQSFRYYKNENSELPKALIIGDSYTWMFHPEYYCESFSEVIFIHANDKNNLNKILNFYTPDIIMFNGLTETMNDIIMGIQMERVLPQIPKKTVKADQNYMFLDYINGESVQNNNPKLFVDEKSECITLTGWGADILSGEVASNMVIKVGEKTYWVNYGSEKPIVVEFYPDKPNWLNTGFDISLPTEEVLKAGGFDVYLISYDRTYTYEPLHFEVKAK